MSLWIANVGLDIFCDMNTTESSDFCFPLNESETCSQIILDKFLWLLRFVQRFSCTVLFRSARKCAGNKFCSCVTGEKEMFPWTIGGGTSHFLGNW